jgi:nucleoside-diphosphate-sugar epimerase
VTGATGFLGSNLVAQLTEAGWDVIAFHRPSSNLDLIRAFEPTCIAGELLDVDSLSEAMPYAVDAVFHVAADVSFWSRHAERQTLTNVQGTSAVCEAAICRGATRLIHTSSVSAWGELDGHYDETRPSTATHSWVNYERTKWAAEQCVELAIAQGLDAVILNPCNIVGPRDKTSWSRLFPMIRDGKLPGLGPGSASWCHVRDVAQAHIAAVEHGRTGERYLLGGPHASFVQVGTQIAHLVGGTPPRELPPWVLRSVGRVNEWISYVTNNEPDVTPEGAQLVCKQWTVDSSKARTELGYGESTLQEMLGDCKAWLVETGRL